MGAAFARSVFAKKILDPENLLLIERDQARCASLNSELLCYVSSVFSQNISTCSVIVLAVKPQDFENVARHLQPLLRPEQIVLSFMGGITLARLAHDLGDHQLIVRSMPNLPFLIGEGMTVYIPSPTLPSDRLNDVTVLLNACGESLKVSDEKLLDAATAISGTGPGYVYYILEHFMRAAVELGFTDEQAELLIASTVTGSVNLWLQDERDAVALRGAVTSPNGTTAAAVEVFERERFGEIFRRGIARACERSRELSGTPDKAR